MNTRDRTINNVVFGLDKKSLDTFTEAEYDASFVLVGNYTFLDLENYKNVVRPARGRELKDSGLKSHADRIKSLRKKLADLENMHATQRENLSLSEARIRLLTADNNIQQLKKDIAKAQSDHDTLKGNIDAYTSTTFRFRFIIATVPSLDRTVYICPYCGSYFFDNIEFRNHVRPLNTPDGLSSCKIVSLGHVLGSINRGDEQQIIIQLLRYADNPLRVRILMISMMFSVFSKIVPFHVSTDLLILSVRGPGQLQFQIASIASMDREDTNFLSCMYTPKPFQGYGYNPILLTVSHALYHDGYSLCEQHVKNLALPEFPWSKLGARSIITWMIYRLLSVVDAWFTDYKSDGPTMYPDHRSGLTSSELFRLAHLPSIITPNDFIDARHCYSSPDRNIDASIREMDIQLRNTWTELTQQCTYHSRFICTSVGCGKSGKFIQQSKRWSVAKHCPSQMRVKETRAEANKRIYDYIDTMRDHMREAESMVRAYKTMPAALAKSDDIVIN